ncbi:MAG: hypothetical protein IPL06_07155 [Betaproteobacteria bacterium]|nr:hypothetical protein [Betaproteobacteria bacterium]
MAAISRSIARRAPGPAQSRFVLEGFLVGLLALGGRHEAARFERREATGAFGHELAALLQPRELQLLLVPVGVQLAEAPLQRPHLRAGAGLRRDSLPVEIECASGGQGVEGGAERHAVRRGAAVREPEEFLAGFHALAFPETSAAECPGLRGDHPDGAGGRHQRPGDGGLLRVFREAQEGEGQHAGRRREGREEREREGADEDDAAEPRPLRALVDFGAEDRLRCHGGQVGRKRRQNARASGTKSAANRNSKNQPS